MNGTHNNTLIGTYPSHLDACKAMIERQPHVVTYFDWSQQRIRLIGRAFESKEQAEAFSKTTALMNYDEIRVIPETQIPLEDRRYAR